MISFEVEYINSNNEIDRYIHAVLTFFNMFRVTSLKLCPKMFQNLHENLNLTSKYLLEWLSGVGSVACICLHMFLILNSFWTTEFEGFCTYVMFYIDLV